MIITPASITALMTSFRKDFQGGLTAAPSQYQQIAMTVPSSSKSNTYGWLGQFPSLREWVGKRVIKQMQAHGYVINNKTYEGTVGIPRDDFEDDNLGVYGPIFAEMGRAAGVQPDELIFSLLKEGFSQPCYDGQNFFDAEHPVYPEVDGTGDAVNVSNIFKQAEDWKGTPWYLLDCSRAVKPLIFQDRRKAELVTKTQIDDDHVFMENEVLFGASARRAVGFAFWQMAVAMQADLNLDNLWTGWQMMRGFNADGGKKLGLKPTHLVVPTQLEKAATQLLERELITTQNGTASNEMKGKLKLVVADYL
ncbi:Mu-like prophage major head subunit gpT family protein [Salmonella enterica]|uniref:Mu-like prophage major head subunit gpT family protein n=1 Tax=Salmonella enterica TaxID=28901 RepID=UPI0009AA1571|nr:Mu-like prophage major head subunit gpT family protein [Salmonella enterica]EEU8018361.1 head protein [Salmonella enterica subsp. enterica serovar Montevideo]EAS1999540.1 head protein [Salmonella enterica]EAY8674139.1 head protein [Salmonella enterica]EDB0137731.1 head protein [Salmonella enterica]EDD0729297.1 head protein [Salmonella enterica]